MTDDTNNLVEESELRSLQKEKLRLEIKTLKRKFWKKPEYVGALAPIVLVVGTLFVAWMNGAFSSELNRLEAKRDLLQIEINTFEAQKKGLDDSLTILSQRAESLSSVSAARGDSLVNNQQEIVQLQQQLDKSVRERASAKDSLAANQGNEENLKARIDSLEVSEKLLTAGIGYLTESAASDLFMEVNLGLPRIWVGAIQHLNDSGKESLYLRGWSLGPSKGMVRVILPEGQKLNLTYPDTTVTVKWSDTLVELNANQIRSPFFAGIKKYIQNPKNVVHAQIQTAEKQFSNTWRLGVRN